MKQEVYVTSLGAFLPGDPVTNEEMEDYLGRIQGKDSRARKRVLRQNGIRTRHYAIDREQRTRWSNSEMAALAAREAISRAGLASNDIDLLTAATTQGDLPVPGFASMVHGELALPACEVASLHGVCSSSLMALKVAALQIAVDDKRAAVACAAEFPSRLFKSSRFEAQEVLRDGSLPFETEFLRWMLSDGAGAAVLRPVPNPRGISLRIDWIQLTSHANTYPVCMYAGAQKSPEGALGESWLDRPDFSIAAQEGLINLKQDIRMLDEVVKLGVDGFFALIEAGRVQPSAIDWLVCHYSSEFFRGKVFKLLELGGVEIPEERWFSNLTRKGNVGAASLFVLLEELFYRDDLQPGQQVFVMIPESGRSIMGYMMMTVVGPSRDQPSAIPATAAEPKAPPLKVGPDAVAQSLVRRLTLVWLEFERELNRVPIIERLHAGTFDLEDYQTLLVNLRQQVIEGARWIARAASQVTIDRFPLRSMFMAHAHDEHRDYQMLERDYVSVGGDLATILSAPKNIGSEALSAWMFHRASRENPFDLLGAMFIIEGLGSTVAHRWGALIQERLQLETSQVSFLHYHADNDGDHFERLESALNSGLLTEEIADQIVKTAKVTARLYRLQLEELGNV